MVAGRASDVPGSSDEGGHAVRRTPLLIAAVVLAAPLLSAAPAGADHVVDAGDEGCRWGAYTNPVGIDLHTTQVSVERDQTGAITSYTCQFKNVPAYVSADDRWFYGDDWHLPKSAFKTSGFECYVFNDWDGGQDVGYGQGVITPAGKASVTCTW